MSQSPDSSRPAPVEPGVKLRGAEKVARIPVKVIPTTELPRKPDWIRVRISNPGEVQRIKGLLREQKLHTVCEEAACPNLPECFGGGTATFMIMGDICTRRCPFLRCRPRPPQGARRGRAAPPRRDRAQPEAEIRRGDLGGPRDLITDCP